MLKLNDVIVVEGKYDRIKLSQFIDASIIETSGFGVFNDPALRKLIADAAVRRGLIVITDSDNAGFQIRRYLRSFVDDSYIKNVYVPAVKGKEKRKKAASSSGILGVEGLSEEIIIKAFYDSGIVPDRHDESSGEKFETIDFYRLGLSGRKNSRKKLEAILRMLGLPIQLSLKETADILGIYMTKTDFAAFCEEHSSELSVLD